MAQFDVFHLRDGVLVVDVQSDLIAIAGTRFVIPIIPPDEDARPSHRLNPELVFREVTYVLATHIAGAVAVSALGNPLGSVLKYEYAIKSALDMLISGY